MKQTLEIRFCDLCNTQIPDEGYEKCKLILPIKKKQETMDEFGDTHTYDIIKGIQIEDICDTCAEKIGSFIAEMYIPFKPKFKLEVKERID